MNKQDIPQAALTVSEREEEFRSNTAKLNQAKDWYNKIRRVCAPVEFSLIRDLVKKLLIIFSVIFITELLEGNNESKLTTTLQVKTIDDEIEKGQQELNWNSPDLATYVEKLFEMVGSLDRRVQKTQDNVNLIRNIMSAWLKNPLFERKDGKKDSLLCLEEKSERIQKRYCTHEAIKIGLY